MQHEQPVLRPIADNGSWSVLNMGWGRAAPGGRPAPCRRPAGAGV